MPSVVARSTPLGAVAPWWFSDLDGISTGLRRVPVARRPVTPAAENDARLPDQQRDDDRSIRWIPLWFVNRRDAFIRCLLHRGKIVQFRRVP
jgi:hypothetical protein